MSTLYVSAPLNRHSPWLTYALGELGRLAGLERPMKLVTPDEVPFGAPHLAYGSGTAAARIPCQPVHRSGAMDSVTLDCGPRGLRQVMVYADSLDSEGRPDLLFNFFAYISCLEEYEWERVHGPAHSYAARLGGDRRRFDRPYANYLALAFRQLVSGTYPECLAEQATIGSICLTHDVDVVSKSMRTRLKEGGFRLFNVLRDLGAGRRPDLAGAARMLVGSADYFTFDAIARLEDSFGFRSSFNLFGGTPADGLGARLRRSVFDPAYDLASSSRLVSELKRLIARGWDVGVHFAFDSWRDPDPMRRERETVERALGVDSVTACRQHWFRFSLAETWKAQWAAGIRTDTTLGFTDRPGFRAGLAARYHPYDHRTGRALPIVVVPTVLMDTHLFYYDRMDPERRREVLDGTLDDIAGVGGEACIIWHSHALSTDHRWGGEYRRILGAMREKGLRDGRVGGT